MCLRSKAIKQAKELARALGTLSIGGGVMFASLRRSGEDTISMDGDKGIEYWIPPMFYKLCEASDMAPYSELAIARWNHKRKALTVIVLRTGRLLEDNVL